MESYQRDSMRRIRRNSKTLLQDLFYRGVQGGDRDTPIPAQPRDARMIHSIASLIRAKSKLLLLENPDTVEIYKLDESPAHSNRSGKGGFYLPDITAKASSLSSIKGTLSQSCPYLYDKRRGSFSSVASQKTAGLPTKKQNNLKAQREAKKSNVTVTMTYLGQGRRGSGSGSGSTQDELKVLQQVNGGQNICVFKGLVTPGEPFQFVSQRHRGFPFSATLYVNGMMVARISSCCEYRYAPGFQQGRKSCFRLAWLAGGVPCYRCTSLRNKYGSCQQLNNSTKENLFLPLEQNTGNGTAESRPSSPLFIPAKPAKKSVRRSRKHIKAVSGGSTDSEDIAVAGTKEAFKKKRRKGQANQKESRDTAAGNNRQEEGRDSKGSERSAMTENSEGLAAAARQEQKTTSGVAALQTDLPTLNKTSKVPDSLQDEEALSKQNRELQKAPGSNGKNAVEERLKDFYEECVEMSAALKQGPNKHHWFKANILERRRLQKRLSSCPGARGSDVELSAESDTVLQPDGEPEGEEASSGQRAGKEEPVKEQDLQAQLDAMMTVLSTSNEVEQLVLRNTDLTDDLLLSLAAALRSSPSEVALLNLNLNLIGPYGAHILLDVLRVKPRTQALHLFGNKLRDHGVLTLLNGIAELQEQTTRTAAAIQQAMLFPPEQSMLLQLPTGWRSFKVFALQELDIGGNGLSSEGVKTLASYMRSYSYLRYLGLAQTGGADMAAWKELFDSLKGNSFLSQIILDENNLGDPGVRLLADMLKENDSLRQVDLDRNGISDVGGNDIMAALLCRTQVSLRHLSLEDNDISPGLMSRIQEEVKCK